MPYFLIVPAFVLYFLAMSAAIVATLLYEPLANLRRYLTSLLIWSSFGFVVSTIVYALFLVVSLKALGQIVAGKPSVGGGIVMGGVVFIAPLVASTVGLIGGGVFGLWRCLKKSG